MAQARLTKKAINEAFAPMARVLLRGGRPAPATIGGFEVRACRQYQIHGRIGPAWNPYYHVIGEAPIYAGTEHERIVSTRGGTRSEMVEWLHRILSISPTTPERTL